MYNPQAVCFCDIPTSDLGVHMKKYSRFGLSFPKSFLTKHGANPVFYVATNSTLGGDPRVNPERENRGEHYDRMIQEYMRLVGLFVRLIMENSRTPGVTVESSRLRDLQFFLDFQVFSYVKAFDAQLPDEDVQNYYMEREWRIVGNLQFDLSDVCRVILPERFAASFRLDLPKYAGQVTFAET